MRSAAVCLLLLLGAGGIERPAFLAPAEQIAKEIDPAHNEYSHKGCFIHWKGEAGATRFENRTDCSEFLNLLLEHTYGSALPDFAQWTGRERPVAKVWYETIAARKRFDVIATIDQMRPGDIIAVEFPPGGDETGHIMILDAAPTARRASPPIIDGAQQWEALIIDSSKSGHGKHDTRRQPDGSFAPGVGQGTLRLYTNPDGSIAGYAWSVLGLSKYVPMAEHKLIVGRLKLPGM